MAENDNKKFDIELGTKADTAGLDATERALRAVEQAGKDAVQATNPMSMPESMLGPKRVEEIEQEAEARTDVAEAAKEQAESLEDIADAADKEQEAQRAADVDRARHLQHLREIEATTKRLVAIQLAAELNNIAQQYRGVNQETDTFLDGLNALTAGLVSGNPFVAVGAAALAAGQKIAAAFQEAAAAEKYANEAAAKGAAMVQRAMEAKELRTSQNSYVEYFRAALKEAEILERKLQSLQRIATATRAADSSDRELSQTNALRSGADVNQVARQDFQGDFQDKINALSAKVDAVFAKADLDAQEQSTLEARLAIAESTNKFDAKQLSSLQADVEDARSKAEQSKQAAEEAAQIAAQESRILFNEFADRFQSESQAVRDDLGQKAQEILQIVDADGRQLTFQQEKARDRIKDALSDGKVTAAEMETLAGDTRTMMSGFQGSLDEQRRLNTLFGELSSGMTEDIRTLYSLFQSQKTELENFRAQMGTRRAGGN